MRSEIKNVRKDFFLHASLRFGFLGLLPAFYSTNFFYGSDCSVYIVVD